MTETPTIGEQVGGEIGKAVGSAVGKEIEQNLSGKKNKKHQGKSPLARRVGYIFGILFALLFLWILNSYEDWGWRFITAEWTLVDRIVRLSIIIDIIIYGVFLLMDGKILYYLGKLISNGFSFYVSIRLFQVFPFDFSYLFNGWTWLNNFFPILIIIGIIGILISFIIRTVRLATGRSVYD